MQLRIALGKEDAEKFRDRAHYLRGSSLIVGATEVARLSADLELKGRDSNFEDAAILLGQTLAALDTVEAELTRRLGHAVVPVQGSAA